MVYDKQTWANDDPSTPISAARLQHLEDGIDQAHTNASTATTKANNAQKDATSALGELGRKGGLERIAAALDFGGQTRVAVVGDSTANDPTDWPKTWLYKQAGNTPAVQLEYSAWNKDTSAWVAHNNVRTVQSAAAGGLVVHDTFGAAAGDVVGSQPDTVNLPGGPWAGTAGALMRDGNGGASFAKVGVANVPVQSIDMKTTAVVNISTAASSAAQAVRVVAACAPGTQGGGIAAQLYVSAAGAASCYLYYINGSTATQLGTTQSLASILPSTQTAAKALTVAVDVNIQNTTVTLSTDLGAITMTGQVTEAQYATLSTSSGFALASAAAPGFVIDSFQVETPAQPAIQPLLKLWNAAVAGGTFATTLPIMDTVFPAETPLDVLVLMMGHNYAGMAPADFLVLCEEYVAAFQQRHPDARVVVVSQNPQVSPAAGVFNHAARQRELRLWAKDKGYSYVPAFETFAKRTDGGKALIAADGVHPSTTTEGTTTGEFGSIVWADAFNAAVNKHRA